MAETDGPHSGAVRDPGSFRDRSSHVYHSGGRVLRALSAEAHAAFRRVVESGLWAELESRGTVVGTRELDRRDWPESLAAEGWAAVLEHERVPFVSYPYEWTFEMLRDAALLQLDLLGTALRRDATFKDATPYNFQFVGARPVLIDVPSLEPYRPGAPWVGYRQFTSQFLYPLLLEAYRGIPVGHLLRGHLEGVDPVDCWGAFTARDLLRPGVFKHVFLHAKAEARFVGTDRNVTRELSSAGFAKELILHNLRGLEKVVRGLAPGKKPSVWVDYREVNSYLEEERAAKVEVVTEAVRSLSPRLVWDLGANTGEYSRLAAAAGASVVAMDSDRAAVSRLYLEERQGKGTGILPLVVDLTDPSPGLGWRGRERRAIWERGRPDLVLALALVHHLVLGANVPLAEVVEWLAQVGENLVVEFVDKRDPMSRKLLLNKVDQFPDYTVAEFERLLGLHFTIRRRVELKSGDRVLYVCAGRAA